jgi:hypothetical protein
MGLLGTDIFDDDLASDVRGKYRDSIAEGKSGSEATDVILNSYGRALTDPREAAVIWLALAATQWESGRLEDRVRDKAVAMLDAGTDLKRWDHDPKLLKQRRRVLERLRARLLSPQPAEKPIHRQYRDTSEWQVGEVIGYRLVSGNTILFRVVDHVTDALGTSPVCELLDWIGTEPPAGTLLEKLAVRAQDWPPDTVTDQFSIVRTRVDEMPVSRIRRLGIKTKPSPKRHVLAMFSWTDLDRSLESRYGSLVRGAV